MKIINRYTDKVIFENDAQTMRETVEAAVKAGADLRGADLSGAYLSGADLRGADLSGADLSGAYLSDADLRRADLRGADLRDADLSRAYLSGTCLAPALHDYARQFAQTCKPVGQHGGRIVYRTATSQHVNAGAAYEVGKTYVANALSWDASTACHPGIYAYGTLAELRDEFPGKSAVRCYVRDGDYTITAKNAIRCARIRVLSEVQS
jgi:hypothetical protein